MELIKTEGLRNLKMIVAYQGTNYAGFQRQRPGLPTIQGVLEESIAKITRMPVNLNGAGRTDSGVHAQGQVVNFRSETRLQCEQLLKALNSVLPPDILVKVVIEVAPEFHARFSAVSKTYSYRIYSQPMRPVFEREFVYHYKHRLELQPMRDALVFLQGQHDFSSFQAAGSAVKDPIRCVNWSRLEQFGPELRLSINADGFLYHMVRNIVGTLILVGNGRLTPFDFQKVIEFKDRSAAGPTAPAQGLCLEEVIYSE